MIDRGKKSNLKFKINTPIQTTNPPGFTNFGKPVTLGRVLCALGSLLEILNLAWIELIASELEVLTGI